MISVFCQKFESDRAEKKESLRDKISILNSEIPADEANRPGRELKPYDFISHPLIQESVDDAQLDPLVESGVDSDIWPERYDAYFRKYTKRRFGVGTDWRWFKSQAIVESELRSEARGPQGAIGLMQLMPLTFDEVDSRMMLKSHQERWHIAVGIFYNGWLWERVRKKVPDSEEFTFTFAAYNAGPGRIRRAMQFCGNCTRWKRVKRLAPPITRNYIKKIFALMDRYPAK